MTHPDPKPVPDAPSIEAELWCVAVNLGPAGSGKAEGASKQEGTKHFRPGAKVYAIGWATVDRESLVVIGHHRKSRQFVKGIVAVAAVQRPCLERITIPTLAALAQKHVKGGGLPLTSEHASALLRGLGEPQTPEIL